MPPAPWRVFGSKSFFRLWLAQVVSSLGDWIGLIAILAIAARVSDNSGAAVSLVMSTRVVPGLLPRHRRRRDHRPLRPSQGDGAAATSAAPACSLALPFVENLPGLRARLARARGPHAAVGPGEGRHRCRTSSTRSSSRRRTRSRSSRRYGTFPIASIIFSLLAGRRDACSASFDVISAFKVDQEVARARRSTR